jgi:hypothetical protein
MKNFISNLFVAECARGNQISSGETIVNLLLTHVPTDKLETILKEVINIANVDSAQLKTALSSVKDTAIPDSPTVSDDKVVANILAERILTQATPYTDVADFIKLVEDVEVERFRNNVNMREVCEYAFSIAEFGEENNVTQTGGIEEQTSRDEIRADHTLYWYNNDNEDLEEGEDEAEDLVGGFYVCISEDGFRIDAGINGNDVTILNHDEVIELTAKEFNIPPSLIA